MESLQLDIPVLGRWLLLLPDQDTQERNHLWEDGVIANGGAICNCEGSLSKETVVDRQQVTARDLSKTEEGIHEELVIHLLESKVWRSLCVKGTFGISKEGPEEIDPTISKKEAIPDVIQIYRSAKGYLL